MIALTLSEVAALSGATLAGGEADRIVSGVSTDTRTLTPGSLFVALVGERDGHAFLAAAASRGAIGAIVHGDGNVPAGMASLRVGDTLEALRTLAAGVRERLRARVVAVTGSAGKTCTKDFTAAALARRFDTTASVASFNNEIGVPLTLLSATEKTEIVVAEIGSRGIGHIRALAPVLAPDVAVVTNVGSAHIGMFGSIEHIAEAKAELVDALGPAGCAVLNADDAAVCAMAKRAPGDVILYGLVPEAAVRAEELVLDEGARASFTLVLPDDRARVSLPVPGEHMVPNALAASAVAHRFGVSAADIALALATVTTSAHRMRVAEAAGGWTVLDDAYNASPASVVAALKTLVVMGRGRRTWAVIGPMAELGERANEEHDRIGRLAVRLGVGRIVTVGEGARATHEAARLEGISPEDAIFVADAESAAKTVLAEVAPGDVVLVKASRVAGLERVVEAILR